MPESDASPHLKPQASLLAALTAGFYSLLTLLPDSNSLVVSWPWVFVWQVGLLCPVLWLLGLLWQGQLGWLGSRLDWFVGALILGLMVSAGLARFPMQAIWYSLATIGVLAALYALSTWLTPDRRRWLLLAQGWLSLGFIIESLTLWISQTLLPELERLRSLQAFGVTLPFDFSRLELRNWAPIGHQNYVAGYLVLVLPLLVGLAIEQRGWRRWLWRRGVALGLVDLYTTSSRAGWLALAVLVLVSGGWLWRRGGRRSRLLSGMAGLSLLAALLLNHRLRSLLMGLVSGRADGELAYRLITVTTGWEMGLSHPITGVGVGGVPLLYQQYRPHWAGREAELAYQLHSTPAQVWAELGLWGAIVGLGAIGWLTVLAVRRLRHPIGDTPPILIVSLYAGLTGYAIVSLFDYQLDNVCISGTLVVFLAVLAAEWRSQDCTVRLPAKSAAIAGVGLLTAAIVWLFPVHRAWMLSSQGFAALRQGDVNTFALRLNQAYLAAPWEPYYANQLGWNLSNLGVGARDRAQQQALLNDGITWLREGNLLSPTQEFGQSNLGWLLLNRDPAAATQAFRRSAQLIPSKRGVFYGLGLSLLAQGQSTRAIEAIALEAVRDPVFITSPTWKLPQLQPLSQAVTARVETLYTELLAKSPPEPLLTQLHQSRGALRWWRGDRAAARTDLDSFGTPIARLVLDLAETKSVQLSQIPSSAAGLTIAAWLTPTQRAELLQRAWITATRSPLPPDRLQEFVQSMARSSSFDQWLKNAPTEQYHRERAGFGVLSRHIDGPIPSDFWTVVENAAIAQLFEPLVPVFVYAPEFDRALEEMRSTVLKDS